MYAMSMDFFTVRDGRTVCTVGWQQSWVQQTLALSCIDLSVLEGCAGNDKIALAT
jgi:hypothetical protein